MTLNNKTALRETGTLVALALLVGSLSACANMRPTQTGFLENYEQLTQERHDVLSFHAPGAHWTQYERAVLEPTVYRPAEGAPRLSENESRELTQHLDAELRETLGRYFELSGSDDTGANTLRVRAAVTDADKSNVWVNVITLIALLPVDTGGATVELEVLDAASGARQAALIFADEGTVLNAEGFWKWGQAKHTLGWSAEWLDKSLTQWTGRERRSTERELKWINRRLPALLRHEKRVPQGPRPPRGLH